MMAAGTLAKVGASVLAFGAGAGLTLVLVDPSDATPTPVALAWVDRPLDGSSVEVADVRLIAHATDPDGLDRVVLTIDGVEVHTEPGDGQTLVTVDTTWTPPGPGTYALVAVGTDGTGHDGEQATATFTVGEPDDRTTTTTAPDGTTTTDATTGEETTTSSSTPTTAGPGSTTPTTQGSTSTTRPPPTTTPSCRPATPAPRSPADGSRVLQGDGVRITWNYAGCGPERFRVQVSNRTDFTIVSRTDYLRSIDVPGDLLYADWELLSCGSGVRRYHWRLQAIDSGGSSAWTAIRSFDVVC